MARVYIDENLAGEFVVNLRTLGHDVVYGGEAGSGKTDVWHFRAALADNRTIITLDKRDFAYFHRLWTSLNRLEVVRILHSGVLVAIQGHAFTLDSWTATAHERLGRGDDISGHMLRWHSDRQEWLEDAWKPED
jgi:hypothetical protein